SDGGVDAAGDPHALTRGHGAHAGESGFLPWDNGRDSGYLHDGTESFYNVKHILDTGSPGTQMDGPGSQDGGWGSAQREAFDFAGWTYDTATDAAGWTYDRATDAAGWTYDKATDTAGWTYDKATDTAGWTYDRVTDGAGWAADKVTSFDSWVDDKLP